MSRVQACIGLGGNVGDVATRLALAFDALAALPDTRLLGASRLFRAPAWGREDQPDFINAAALLETGLTARALLEALLAIEARLGRTRADDGSDRWGPRAIDLDLLLFGEQVVDEAGLQVPHPHLHERAFALLPLADVAPGARIPGIGTVAGTLAGLDASGIEALP